MTSLTPHCDLHQLWPLQPAARCLRPRNPARLFFSAALGLTVLAACSGSHDQGSSFAAELAQVQSAMPREAQLLNAAGPHRGGLRTEASWEYAIRGSPDAVRKALAGSVPPGYRRVRGSDTETAYAKYDGHDSFYLTFTLAADGPQATRVTVRLRSIPD